MAATNVRLLPGATPSPTGAAAAAVGTGGTFAAATYFWKVTFVTDWGETEASNEATVAVVLNGSATISWTLPTNAPPIRQVNAYRGTSTGNENALVASALPTGGLDYVTATSLTDTGAAGVAQTPPATTTFVPVTLNANGTVSDADATISSLPNAAQQLQAIAAAEEWQNSAGTSADAQANANAIGLGLAWQ